MKNDKNYLKEALSIAFIIVFFVASILSIIAFNEKLHNECKYQYLLCDDGKHAIKTYIHTACFNNHCDSIVDVFIIDGCAFVIENDILVALN